MSTAKQSFGSYILAGAAAVSLVALVLYRTAYSTTGKATGFIIASAVVAAACIAGAVVTGNKLFNWAGTVCAALAAVGLGWSLTVMVDAIGYVISGLYQFSTLQTYITFCIVAGCGWLLYIVSAFTGIVKK